MNYVELSRIGKAKWSIEFDSRSQTNSAMNNRFIKETGKFKLEIPWFLVHRNGVIRHIPISITIDALEEEIKKSNPSMPVIALCRLKKKGRKDDGTFELMDTKSVKITIRSSTCPSHLIIWKLKTPVSPFVPSIRRCFRCG